MKSENNLVLGQKVTLKVKRAGYIDGVITKVLKQYVEITYKYNINSQEITRKFNLDGDLRGVEHYYQDIYAIFDAEEATRRIEHERINNEIQQRIVRFKGLKDTILETIQNIANDENKHEVLLEKGIELLEIYKNSCIENRERCIAEGLPNCAVTLNEKIEKINSNLEKFNDFLKK